MEISELYIKLYKLKIRIKLVGEELDIKAPKGVLTMEIVNNIKVNKKELIVFLKKEQEKLVYTSIPKVKEKTHYLLSSAQKRLYLLQQFDLDSTAYNIPYIIPLGKEADKGKIEEVFKQLINRHESFRTSINVVDGEPVQLISKNVEFELEEINIENTEIEHTRNKFIKPFNLSKAPFLRVAIVDIKGEDSLLMLDMHHIISDGTSQAILEKEFQVLFLGEKLPPLTLHYKDYSEWQNSKEQQLFIKNQEQYWLNKFEGEIPVLNLPIDYVRPIMKSHEGAKVSFVLCKEETERIKIFTKENDLTLYMSLLSAFSILLSKLSGQDDIVVGTPIVGRNHADLENIVGVFINTLAIRNEVKAEATILEFVLSLKQTVLGAYKNQNYQFEDLVDKVSVERNTSRNPIFDVMINLLNQAENSGDLSGFNNQEQIHEIGMSKFDLTLTAVDYGNQIMLSFSYCNKLFQAETIERFIAYFKRTLNQIPERINENITTIEIISTEEKEQLLYEFNDTKQEYPRGKNIIDLFGDQVERTPSHIALINGFESLTYSELNKRTNRVARYLRKKGEITNSVVSLFFEPSIDMLISIIGVLKSGATYLPINTELPSTRLIYMLEDSGSDILLTHSQVNIDTIVDIEIVDIVDAINKTSDGELEDNKYQADSAYLIYTSGTTGNPKGVLLSHNNLINYFTWFNKIAQINNNDKTVLVTSYAFDLGYTGLYSSLLNGSQLHLLSKDDYLSVDSFVNYILEHNITYLKLTSSLYTLLTESTQFANAINNLRLLILGGESINVEAVKASLLSNPALHVINHYGPTEATIGCISYSINKENINEYENSPVIGTPINNTKVYILSASNQLQPIGVSGELCVSGDGLAGGYINNPELTKDKFIAHPFTKGDRLYKTGDLARRLSDGNIEFLGRVDDQVKIRGFRIELGEIESALLNHENVRDSVVLAREEGENKYLCAYIVLEDERKIEDLRSYLAGLLPDYMIPSYFVELKELPLTSNGKVNRKALPSPEVKVGNDYVAPTNETEKKLTAIWSEVLNIPKEEISVTANFFAIGGHSLRAVVVASSLSKFFNIEISVNDIFLYDTVSNLAEVLLLRKTETNFIDPVEKKSYYNLHSAPKRLFMVNKMESDSKVYNIFKVYDLPSEINKNKVQEIFKALINRHEILRSNIRMLNDEIVLIINDTLDICIEEYRGDSLKDVIDNFIRPFDLETDPLIRVGYYVNDSTKLLIDMHHVISDAYSQNILIEEFLSLSKSMGLMPLRFQYKDFSEWKNRSLKQSGLKQQKEFWFAQFHDFSPGLKLPLDFERPQVQTFTGAFVHFKIDSATTSGLKAIGNDSTTMFMVMLSMYTLFLSKVANSEDVAVGTPTLGRDAPDLDLLVGMFINTLALRFQPASDQKFVDFLEDCKELILDSFKNQDYPMEDLLQMLSLPRDTSRNPLFDVGFVYTDQELNKLENSIVDEINYGEHKSSLSKFDITLIIQSTGEELLGIFQYNTNLFFPESIDRFVQYFKNIVKSVAENNQKTLGEIDVLTKAEKQQMLDEINNISLQDENIPVYEFFNRQVLRSLKGNAVVQTVDFQKAYLTMTDDHEMLNDKTEYWVQEKRSYQEINEEVDKLSRYLLSLGIEKNHVVAIMFSPSIEMIVSILAVLKLGAIYLPIDPTLPADRIKYVLKDSNCNLLLTLSEIKEIISIDINIITVDDYPVINGIQACKIRQKVENVYIIYTSGSTGKPKGVLIKNENINNYIQWFTNEFKLNENDKSILTSSYSYDLGYTSVFPVLSAGGELHLLEKEFYLDSGKLLTYIFKNQITYLKITPSFFSYLIASESFENANIQSLRLLALGGEAIKYDDLRLFFDKDMEIEVINHYGPTEATIGCVFNKITKKDVDTYKKYQIIGNPVLNTKAIILSDKLNLLPGGVEGGLFITGKGVANGYVNNPEITWEKFKSETIISSSILYETGDKARMLSDGRIEFLGRNDNQIKLRGYRVELGEIENEIKKINSVKNAVVQIKENQNSEQYICAYIEKIGKQVQHIAINNNDIKSLLDNIIEESINPDSESNELYWKSNGLSKLIVEKFTDDFALNEKERVRYKRQILLDNWGVSAQERLKSLTVFVAGAGGGASPTITQLALLGIGKIIVCDYDDVELSNLNRQFLHDESRLGKNKAESAKMTIERLNPNVEVEAINEKLTDENVMDMIGDADIIFDMFDGMKEKFLLSRSANKKGVPHVVAAMIDINSYSAIFYPPFSACFHCVFDEKKLDVIYDGFKEIYGGHNKKSLAVAAPSLFTSSGFIINEFLKLYLDLSEASLNKFFYFNQKRGKDIANADSYKAMTYAFSEGFVKASNKIGCDWENGWEGKSLEEIEIPINPQCVNCNSKDDFKSVESPSFFKENIKTYKSNGKPNNQEKCVAIYVERFNDLILSASAVFDCDMTIVPMSPFYSSNLIENILIEYNVRLILTSSSLFEYVSQLKNRVNKNIWVQDIDQELPPLTTEEKIVSQDDKRCLKVARFEISDDKVIKQNIMKGVNDNNKLLTVDEGQPFNYSEILKRVFGSAFFDAYQENQNVINEQLIVEEISKSLPEYMWPSKYVILDKFPITNNGKVDVKKLSAHEKESNDLEPKSEMEKLLFNVWNEYLGNAVSGVETNFFAVGGDSIKAIQILSKLHSMGYRIEMSDIFNNPTIISLVPKVKANIRQVYQGPVQGEFSLSPIQQYFIQLNEGKCNHFNMSVMLQFKQKYNLRILYEIFNKIIHHHDALRMNIVKRNGEYMAYNHGIETSLEIIEYNLKNEETPEKTIHSISTNIHKEINIESGILIKLAWFHLENEDHLLIIINHFVIDGVSWRILFEDINILIDQIDNGMPLELPQKTDSYKKWAEEISKLANSQRILDQIDYWKNIPESSLNIIPKKSKRENLIKDNAYIRVKLDESKTGHLLKNINSVFGTEINDILIAALAVCLRELSEENFITIGLEGHGRDKLVNSIDINRTVGWFTNFYPVSIKLPKEREFSRVIKEVKENIRNIPDWGMSFNMLRYISGISLEDRKEIDIAPQISFNYLGQFDTDVEDKAFQMSRYSPGQNMGEMLHRGAEIDIIGRVALKELSFSIIYNKELFDEKVMKDFSEGYITTLVDIIEYCMSYGKQDLTPSDLGYNDISIEDLENFF